METINEDILIRYLDGALPENETSAVEEWLAASAANQRMLEQLYYTMQVVKRVRVVQSADPEKALQRFKTRIHKQNKKAAIRRTLRMAERAAAVLFLPLLLLSVYMGMHRSRQESRMIEVHTNPGVVSAFRLPDGSQVWLNAGSTLKYPSDFVADRREVELQGQGYFEVARDEKKPFIVQAGPDYAVEVLGTTFDMAAYEDEEAIQTTLVEGSVKLHLRTIDGKPFSRKLEPNEKAEFERDTRRLAVATVNTEYDTAWKNGEIIFRNHPMEQVLKVLSRHYHVKFRVQDPQVLKSIITAKFKDEQLPQVMEYLRLASSIQYTIHKPSITSDQKLDIPIIDITK